MGLRRILLEPPTLPLKHLTIGVILALTIPFPLPLVATTILAPFGAILFGMSFAWALTFTTLMQTEEGRHIGKGNDGQNFRKLVMLYQLALLIIFATTILWALVGAGTFTLLSQHSSPWLRVVGRSLVFALSSLAVYEAWSAVSSIQMLMLTAEWLRRRDEHDVPPENVQAEEESVVAPTKVRVDTAEDKPEEDHSATDTGSNNPARRSR